MKLSGPNAKVMQNNIVCIPSPIRKLLQIEVGEMLRTEINEIDGEPVLVFRKLDKN